jgi:Protein of unknown function (DUF2939)
MRTTILISAALIAVWLAYAASPFFAVYDLLRLVQERNLAELPARIDFPAVRRSLTAQIVRTYLRITGKIGQSGSIAEQFAVSVGASLADPIVAKLVAQESVVSTQIRGHSSVFSGCSSRQAPTRDLPTSVLLKRLDLEALRRGASRIIAAPLGTGSIEA